MASDDLLQLKSSEQETHFLLSANHGNFVSPSKPTLAADASTGLVILPGTILYYGVVGVVASFLKVSFSRANAALVIGFDKHL